MTDTVKQQLIDECHRQEENCKYTALSFTIWLRWLRRMRAICTTAPVLFGVVATAKIVAQSSPEWAAVFTLLAVVIPPTYRASKIDKSIDLYERLSGEFTNVRDRFRQAALIESERSLPEFEKEAEALFKRIEKARELNLAPPEWCFRVAQRKIKRDDYRHDYDGEGGRGALKGGGATLAIAAGMRRQS